MPILISPLKMLWFRVSLGVYLLWTFFSFWNETSTVFSFDGMFKDYAFPYGFNVLMLGNDIFIKSYLALLMLVSGLLIFKWLPKFAFLFLWYGWFCFLSRIPYYVNPPNVSYIGFLLLCLIFVDKKEDKYSVDPWLIMGMWVVMGLSYSVSGIGKIISSNNWQDGSTLNVLLELSFIQKNNFFVDFCLRHKEVLSLLSHFTLLAEAGFIFLIFNRYTRTLALLSMTSVHLGILLLLKIDSIPLGMLLYHIFLIEGPFLAPEGSFVLKYNQNSKVQSFLSRILQREGISILPSSSWEMSSEDGVKTSTFKALAKAHGFWRWYPWK